MDAEDRTCVIAGVKPDPVFTGDYSFNTGGGKQLTPADYTVLAATLIISALISVYFACGRSGLHMDLEEYLLAGRSMAGFPVGVSLFSSFTSAVTLLGVPAEVYDFSVLYLWVEITFFFTTVITADVYIPVFYHLRVATAYEYLELRFARGLRTVASCMFLLQTILYTAVVLFGPSVAFHVVTGLSLWGSIITLGVVCTLYTALGGMRAVVWTDVFQLGVMLLGVTVLLHRASSVVGSFSSVYDSAVRTKRMKFLEFGLDPTNHHSFWSLVFGGLFSYLCFYSVSQTGVQKWLSCRTLKHAKIAMWMTFPGHVVFTSLGCIIGLYMGAFYENCDPVKAQLTTNSKQLVPLFSMDILSDTKGLPGVVLAAICCATLSTVSTALNSMTAVLLEDFIKFYMPFPLTEQRARLYSQIITIIFGAFCLELTHLMSVMDRVFEATFILMEILAAPLFGVFSLGLLFPWANTKGARTGLFTSFAALAALKIQRTLTASPIHGTANTCVRYCNISAFSVKAQISLKKLADTSDENTVVLFKSISFLWYPLIGVGICIASGLLASYATGFQDPQKLDPRLIVSVCDVLFPFYYLPESTKELFRFGMEHKGAIKLFTLKEVLSQLDDDCDGAITRADVYEFTHADKKSIPQPRRWLADILPVLCDWLISAPHSQGT